MSNDEHLTPAQRIGRLIGDLDCAKVEINPQHHVWRLIDGVQKDLHSLKESLSALDVTQERQP